MTEFESTAALPQRGGFWGRLRAPRVGTGRLPHAPAERGSLRAPAAPAQSHDARNRRRLAILAVLVLAAFAAYMLVGVNFGNERLASYAMKVRAPKVAAILVAAFAIGSCTVVFQTIINNKIVTPCLLGMNSLYTLVHTLVYFFAGAGSIFAINANISFGVDLVVMVLVGTLLYSWLFKLTNYNVLYILLIGTVLTSLFGAVQSTLVRVMDPNEYDALLATITPSFNNVNLEVIAISAAALAVVAFVLRREIALLNVITLGKDQAIALGVDYDRVIRRLLVGIVLYIAVATAMVGPITFLGLIVANLARQLIKTYKHGYLIPGAALFGGVVLLGGQVLVERLFHYVVPVSVIVSVAGGLYFLILLMKEGE